MCCPPPHGFNNGFKYFSKCGTLDANIGKWHLVVVEYEKEDTLLSNG